MSEGPTTKEKTKARMKAWREANRERVREYQKKWNAANAEKVAEYQKAYMKAYQAQPDKRFDIWMRNLMRNYRLTPEGFNALWAKQCGKCAICACELLPRGRDKRSATVDHNHATGEVRGLLCRHCNHGIGCLQDSPEVLTAAAAYLRDRGHYAKTQPK